MFEKKKIHKARFNVKKSSSLKSRRNRDRVETATCSYRWAESTCGTSATTFGAELGDGLFGEVCPLLGLLKLLLRLAELGKVQRSDLLRFLDLPLVRLDLLLELVDQVLHALVVLTVLVRLEAMM